jgi:hypothetical protein
MISQGERERTYTMAALDLSGEWQTNLPDDATDVVAVVRARTGKGLTEQPLALADIAKGKISIEIAQPEMQHYKKMPQNRLKGRAIDAAGQAVAYLPIVGYAKEMHLPLFFTTTDSEGRFAIELSKEMPEQIVVSTLDGSSALVLTPKELRENANKILLFNIGKNTATGDKSAAKAAGGTDISEPITDPDDCACNGLISNTPRVPSTFTYANSNQFSQDINACEPLTAANRSVEEFKFYKIARTSQPVVRKFAFGKMYNELKFWKAGMSILSPSDTDNISVYNSLGVLLGRKPVTFQGSNIYPITTLWDPVLRPDQSQVWGISKIGGGADWANQEWDSAIDWTRGWDAGVWKATMHQATSFAHGRIFVMKQTIVADGHSKGEVVGSDTLLPGEKRQKALLTWEREESASRAESGEQADSLVSNLSRNRDISEVVKGIVTENSTGSSETKGKSAAMGYGVAATIPIEVPIGISMGIAASANHQTTTSAQHSDRNTAVDSLQQLHDNTQQSASSLRALRSLVVQNVRQSEKVDAETFVIANHNHCHALSVFYHRVLAHYVVKQELIDIKEALFIPMQMRPFEMDTIVRYREVLRRAFLLGKKDPLYSAFDAAFYQYVTQKSPEGIVLEGNTVVDQHITAFSGAITINFFLNIPADDKTDISRTEYAQLDIIKDIPFLNGIVKPLETTVHDTKYSYNNGNWEKYNIILRPDMAVNGQTWNDVIIHDGENNNIGALRKAEFEQEVLPTLVANITKKIRIFMVTDATTNATTELPLVLKPSQKDSFKIGEPITFQLETKSDATILSLTPAQMKGIKIAYLDSDAPDLPTNSAVRLTNVFLQYQTEICAPTTFLSKSLSTVMAKKTDAIKIEFETPTTKNKTAPLPFPRLIDALVEHFNLNLEYYHRVIWLAMDAQTRFNILDGMVYDCIAEMDNAQPPKPKIDGNGYVIIKSYRTVAQVTENMLVGIVGNSWVLPAAKGTILDATITIQEDQTLFSVIKDEVDVITTRISVPTPGIYAETHLSACNACEPIYEDSSQDWTKFKTDEPTAINPLDTGTRYQNPGNLQPKDMQQPIINIQNAPTAPDPQGLAGALGLLGTQGLFKDITGLEGTQQIALQGMLGNQQAAQNYAEMASKLAALGMTDKLMKNIEKSGLPADKQAELMQTLLGNAANFNGLGGNGKNGGFNIPDAINQARKSGQSPTRLVSNTADGGYQQVDLKDNQLGALIKTIPEFVNGVKNPEIAALRAQGYVMKIDENGNVEVYAGTSGGGTNEIVDTATDSEDWYPLAATSVPWFDDRRCFPKVIQGNPATRQLTGIIIFTADSDFTPSNTYPTLQAYCDAFRAAVLAHWQNNFGIRVCNSGQQSTPINFDTFVSTDLNQVFFTIDNPTDPFLTRLQNTIDNTNPCIDNNLVGRIAYITVGSGASNPINPVSNIQTPLDAINAALVTGYMELSDNIASTAPHEFGHLCGLADRYVECCSFDSTDITNAFVNALPTQNNPNPVDNATHRNKRTTLPIALLRKNGSMLEPTYNYRTNIMSNPQASANCSLSSQQRNIVLSQDSDVRNTWERTPFRVNVGLPISDYDRNSNNNSFDAVNFDYDEKLEMLWRIYAVKGHRIYFNDSNPTFPLDTGMYAVRDNNHATPDFIMHNLWLKVEDAPLSGQYGVFSYPQDSDGYMTYFTSGRPFNLFVKQDGAETFITNVPYSGQTYNTWCHSSQQSSLKARVKSGGYINVNRILSLIGQWFDARGMFTDTVDLKR